jgi:hypothetical protein
MTTKTTTITDASAMLGISRQALSKTLKRACVLPGPDGKFDSVKVFQAVRDGSIADKATQGCAAPGSLAERKLLAQIRNLEATARRAEIEIQKIEGGLISVEEHHRRIMEFSRWARLTIDNWVRTTASASGDIAVKKSLEAARRKCFDHMRKEYEHALAP